MNNPTTAITDAMLQAARQASDWVADLRDEEISHIYLAMHGARPPMKIIPAQPIVFETGEPMQSTTPSTPMDICEVCSGAGDDGHGHICGKCDGAGGYPGSDLLSRLQQVRDLIEEPAFITVSTGFARYNADERDLILRAVIEAADKLSSLQKETDTLKAERDTPQVVEFAEAVQLEAWHQRDRWGADHDAGKTPFDWFWLVGYLAQKAASAQVAGDADKALHHTISTAAALANWHLAISGAHNRMVPGAPLPTMAQADASPKGEQA
jgi:hypothetical protein